MTRQELLERIEELENQLDEYDELEEYKEEVEKCVKQAKIIIEAFKKQGLSQEFAEKMVMESIRKGGF